MEDKKIILKQFKPDSVIKIEVNANFYKRTQRLFFWYIHRDYEKAVKAIERLKTLDPQDEFEEHLLTLMSLVYGIEHSASDQGFLVDKEVTFKPA